MPQDPTSDQGRTHPVPNPEDTVSVTWETSDPGDGARSEVTSGRRQLVIIGAVLVAVVLVVIGWLVGRGPSGETAAPPAGGSTSTSAAGPASSLPATPSDSSALPTEQSSPEQSSGRATGQPSASSTPTSPIDPPASGGTDQVEVVRSASGKACLGGLSTSPYGGYPQARCRFWKSPSGLRESERIDKGTALITCQRDLELANPSYAKDQSNTWWLWTRSSSGTWDWYPETAVVEGASDEPINGIALCR